MDLLNLGNLFSLLIITSFVACFFNNFLIPKLSQVPACMINFLISKLKLSLSGPDCMVDLLISKDLQVLMLFAAIARAYWGLSPPPVYSDLSKPLQWASCKE